MDAAGADDAANGVPDQLLRSALELAIGVAAVGARQRTPLPFPGELKPLLRVHRLPPAALGRVRRAVEDDPEFLARVAAAATDDVVDEIGMLWLGRPDGWRQAIEALVAGNASAHEEALATTRREQRRREAAEQSVDRLRRELIVAHDDVARLGAARDAVAARLADSRREAAALRAEAGALERTHQDLRDEAARSAELAASAVEERRSAAVAAAEAEAARDAALMSRANDASGGHSDDRDASAALIRWAERALQGARDALHGAADALDRGVIPVDPGSDRSAMSTRGTRPARRTPVAIPGGLYGHSQAAAAHVLRVAGVHVLVDGYNVAKLAWPDVDLERQRELAIAAAEDVARRWGTAITVVFDGADVAGAAAPTRRLVRVVYSSGGVSADDVLRAEVHRLDVSTPVVVVTNDRAVVGDVRARGANTVSSETFLLCAGR